MTFLQSNICLLIASAFVLAGCEKRSVPTERVVLPPSESIVLREDLQIGGDETSGVYFGGITHVAVDDSALIYVSDWRSRTISVFDSTGVVRRTIGGPGEGPGEFRQSPGGAIVSGDSVSVFSYGGLVQVFERADGSFRRRYTLPRLAQHSISGVMRRVGNDFIMYASGSHPPTGDGRNLLVRVDMASDTATVVYSMPTTERPLRGEGGNITSVPYTRGPRCASTDERFFCGFTDEVLFTELSLAGDSLGALRVDFEPLPITSSERSTFEDRYAGTEFESSLDIPATWPAYYSVWGDSKGRLWVRMRDTRADTSSTFWIVDPKTSTAVSTTITGVFRPTQDVGGKLYGVHQSSSGEQSVVRYVIQE